MKTLYSILIALVVLAAIVWMFFWHTYTSSPGFVTQEYAEEFAKAKPTCYGYERLLNAEATYADAPGKSLCIGLLK